MALLVLDGHGLKVVAGELGVSTSTVRTHLLSIFRKTNTHRQAELVRLLAKLTPNIDASVGAAPGLYSEQGRTKKVALRGS